VVTALRALLFASLALAAIPTEATQGSSVLHIRISIAGADQRPVPLPRHALLVGEDPPSAAPRRVVTGPDGTAAIPLRPGRYLVESDQPSALQGRAYRWSQIVDLVAGRDTTLTLTAANADSGAAAPGIEAAPVSSPSGTEPGEAVTVWTEHRRTTGTVVSGTEVVETRASEIGDATSVEVQLSPTEKVAGRVVSTDPARDLALVQIDRAITLPVESSNPLPLAAMRTAALAGGFSLSPYTSSSSEFDILFITPVLLARAEMARGRTGAPNSPSALRPVTDFGEWSDYVSESPPVLFIRATPKRVESLWMKLARAAAYTQGAAIPPIQRIGPGFSRMRVLCGIREIPPIHPFRIRTSVSETEAVDEGFYAFDPMAIGPDCGTVSLVLSSVKDPGKTETRVVTPAVIAQVWKDFAPYRE
jgi:hypothetical protein